MKETIEKHTCSKVNCVLSIEFVKPPFGGETSVRFFNTSNIIFSLSADIEKKFNEIFTEIISKVDEHEGKGSG